MILPSRVLRAVSFALAFLVAAVPVAAQVAAPQPTVVPTAAPAPQHARPDDPWIYRGTDIPVDRQWLFGELPNGLRYAVRRNGVPPGQVSIRVRIDAGSLHERDSERGFAHLLEHLTFRQSKYLGDGEAIPHFQRLGAGFGSDTNALTTPTQTVYKLDLPNARPAVLEDSVRLISGMIREPTLSPANVAADLPIVLAEGRESAGPARRMSDATLQLFFSGQRLAERLPIGLERTLQAASSDSVRAFHRRWYRPERAVVVLAGDADPQFLATLVERYFGDWQVSGAGEPEPDFGVPTVPRGATGINPVGETRVLVEPGQPRMVTLAYLRPWQGVVDNLEYNRGLLIDAIAEAIVNRRLESRARGGGDFLFAGVNRDKPSRSADGTYVSFAPLTADWQASLGEVRAVIADAVATPPSQEDIDRELAEFDIQFVNQVEQSRSQAGASLADDLVNAVDIREAIASPETFLEVFRGMRDRFTPAAVHEHTRALFTGRVVRALLVTPEPGEADAAAVRTAMLAPVAAPAARGSGAAIRFADLPPIGTPQPPAGGGPLGLFTVDDVEGFVFPNGVRALLRPTDNEPGRLTVRVRFGAGRRAFAPDEAVYAALGEAALIPAGIGPLGQEELDRLATGRKFGLDFRIEEGTFVLEGLTRPDDLTDQLYLMAAKLAQPGWDPQPVERAKASALLTYEAQSANPGAIINRDLDWLLSDRDPRFATPAPEAIRAATPEQFKAVWSRLLEQGPVEVSIFGDFERDKAVEALSATFGALVPRQPAGPADLARAIRFPAGNAEPVVVNHRGEADQAAAVIAWPTAAGSAELPQSRKVELLAQVFSNRLLDALREHEGASYSPYVGATWPLDIDSGGRLTALAQLPPDRVGTFFDEADKIAADLAQNGPSADELARATEPMLQLIRRLIPAHAFWLNQLQGGAFDPNRFAHLRTLADDYSTTTPQELQALAARYLVAGNAFRVAVLPEAGAARGAR
ncbi:MAG: peptidase M16 [Sphingomonadales bacterium 32-68-7]|nr:MAG: peptidase M16 [Sphingomonadales bacterium 12-68-11]OYX10474.1 MAG: peptidase M16 [Sphingomonadales bacterium 32-68-7]